jgi:glycosyltransferase involved in cell wall biosynthesis
MKKICFFGIFDENYSRNRVLIKGFKENNFEVYFCKIDPSVHKGIKKFYELYLQYKKIKENKFDHVLVAFPGHSVVWLARILFGNNIIFDAFVSLYNSNYQDRRKYFKYSLSAFKDKILDWYSIRLCKYVLLDTNAHIDYFVENYGLKREKAKRVFVGTDDSIMYPRKIENKTKDLIVHFHGSFIPLQGIEYIIHAFNLIINKYEVKDIKLRLIGKGQESEKIKRLINSLNLFNHIEQIDKVNYETLPEYICNSSVVLGIFGKNIKSDIVIPNKVYEAIGCGKILITSNTKAIRELLNDRVNSVLIEQGNSVELAQAIIDIKNKELNIKEIEENILKVRQNIIPINIVKNLISDLKLIGDF